MLLLIKNLARLQHSFHKLLLQRACGIYRNRCAMLDCFRNLASNNRHTPKNTGYKTMARITVEDCIEKIPNRFVMTLVAAYRARELAQGHEPRVESRNKPAVTALREIAAGATGLEMLRKVPT